MNDTAEETINQVGIETMEVMTAALRELNALRKFQFDCENGISLHTTHSGIDTESALAVFNVVRRMNKLFCDAE